MRTFVYRDAASHKFWSIDVRGKKHVVRFGKVGANGQTQEKTFPSSEDAAEAAEKLIREKTRKGYVEQAAAPAPPPPAPSSERKALEAALLANPDDVAAHSAYADYLTEQGDPRGEFVQVQLALEDASLSKAQRATLKKQEEALLGKHAATWLGDAGRFLVGDWSGPDKPVGVTFARGWADEVRMLFSPAAAVAAIVKAPESRFVRRLDVVYDMRFHAYDDDELWEGLVDAVRPGEVGRGFFETSPTLPLLAASPHLTNLRALRYGFSDADETGHPRYTTMGDLFGAVTAKLVLDVLARCPRLEELYLNVNTADIPALFGSPALGQLRAFQYYFGQGYPLAALAKNRALKRLETLRVHPGQDTVIDPDQFVALVRSAHLPALRHLHVHTTRFGPETYRELAESGAVGRLKTLDLSYGNMTDDGARALAASPDLTKLDLLDVSRNGLTAKGVRALKKTGVRLAADHQHDPDEGDDEYWVDVE